MATASEIEGDLDIILMGLTGHGKSATGNSILGHKNFISRGGWGSVTKDYHVGSRMINGRCLKIVDIPGYSDTDEVSDQEKLELVLKALTKAVVQIPNGFHAVLLVVPYTVRLTTEQRNSIQCLINLFDSKAFKSHGILVLSSGDAFKRDYEDTAVEEWIEQQAPKDRWVFETCSSRCVLFDNVTKDKEIKEDQLNELISCIDNLDNGNKRYLPEIAKCSSKHLRVLVDDKRKVIDKENLIICLGLLKSSILKYAFDDNLRCLTKDITDIKEMISNNSEYKSTPDYQDSFEIVFEDLDSILTITDRDTRIDELFDEIDCCTELQNEIGETIELTKYWEMTKKKVENYSQKVDVAKRANCVIS